MFIMSYKQILEKLSHNLNVNIDEIDTEINGVETLIEYLNAAANLSISKYLKETDYSKLAVKLLAYEIEIERENTRILAITSCILYYYFG